MTGPGKPRRPGLPGAAHGPGLLFAVLGLAGLLRPLAEFRPNRIMTGEPVWLTTVPETTAAVGLMILVLVAAVLTPAAPRLRALAGTLGLALAVWSLGFSATTLSEGAPAAARVSPAAGFWMLGLSFSLMIADALARLKLSLAVRWLLLAGAVIALGLVLAAGWLDSVSVMREYAARRDLFHREALRHVQLAAGGLAIGLGIGLPLGILLYEAPRLRESALEVLNVIQTIPSLALFGIMIPLLGWVAAHVPGATALGIAGIGVWPALIALGLYSLLPIVSNTLVGLTGVSPAVREAALGLGMTRGQLRRQVLLPLTLPVLLAAVRIVLIQNIGLAVIAGLIGGGGFGSFVFQGLNQTAMDMVLLGTLPTIALALAAGIAMNLAVEQAGIPGGRTAPP